MIKSKPQQNWVTPENRKGWLIVIGFMLIVAAFFTFLVTRDSFSIALIAAWAVAMVAVLFFWIAWKKKDEA